VLEHAGKVELIDDIVSAKFMKLVVNSMLLGPKAMVGGEQSDEHPAAMTHLIMRIGQEALAVGEALGHPVVPIFGLKLDEDLEPTELLQTFVDKLNRDIGPAAGANTTLQDHMKGRLSEVDVINGLIVEESVKRGMAAPANAALVEVTRRIHSWELEPDPVNLKLAIDLLEEADS